MQPPAEIALIVATVRASNALLRASRRLFKPFGLTEVQFNILHVLQDAPHELTQRELSDILVVDRSNVTGLIDRMEAMGWVQRQPSPGDRRAYRIRLTTAGRKLWQLAYPAYEAAANAVVAELSPAQIKAAARALETVEAGTAKI
jgi:DNA-binding MarR family transcriptional regulator